jgi:hypothetical protein
MSKLASKITATPIDATRQRPGPPNRCFPLYGDGDLEDWQAVEALRYDGRLDWRSVQAHVDKLAGVEQPLPLEAFRRHWRRRCYCWPQDLRR